MRVLLKVEFVLLAGLALVGDLLAATINFDDLDAAVLPVASSHYQSLGVLFSRDVPVLDLRVAQVDALFRTNFFAAGWTTPNVLSLGRIDGRLDIDMSFVIPGTIIPTTTDYVRALFGDGNVGTSMGTIEAFDAQGKSIALVTSNAPPSMGAILAVSAPGIARVRFSVDGDGGAIDNVYFNGPRSDIFGILTTTNKEFAGGMAFSGSNYLAGIQGNNFFQRLPASNQVAALLMRPDGTPAGPMIDTGRQGSAPVAAFGANRYLLVWADYRADGKDVFGQLLNPDGAAITTPFKIAADATDFSGTVFSGGVIFDGSNFLVVWQYTGAAGRGIRAQLVTPSGALAGPQPVTIAQGLQNNLAPALAFDGTNSLVAWYSRRNTTDELYDVLGCLVAKLGTTSATFAISQSPSPSYNPPGVAWDGTHYFVVWNRDIGPGYPSPSNWDVYGRMILPNGTPVGNELPVNMSPGSQAMPRVVYDGKYYLIYWLEGWQTASPFTECQYFDTTGTALGAKFHEFESLGSMIPFVGYYFDGTRLVGGANYIRADASGTIVDGDLYGFSVPGTRDLPRLDPLAPVNSGQFRLRLTGIPGFNYTIQAVTNLSSENWGGILSQTTTNMTTEFVDPNAAAGRRFYRAVMQ